MRQIFPVVFALVLGAGCSQWPSGFGVTDLSSSGLDGNSAQGLTNTYESQALSILQQNCTSCHTDSAGPLNVFNLLSPTHLVQSGLVVPGSPGQSSLYTEIQTGAMPPSGALSSVDQAVIANWIAASANAPTPGATPTPTPTPGTGPTPTPAPSAPTFSTIESQIFAVHCTSCHSSQSAAAGYAFDSYNGVMKGVNTGSPSNSLVYTITNSGQMPTRGSSLTAAQESLLLAWIQAGAPNN